MKRLKLQGDDKGLRGLTISIGSHSYPIGAAKEVSFSGISSGYPGPILVGVGSDVISRGLLTVDYRSGLVLFEPN